MGPAAAKVPLPASRPAEAPSRDTAKGEGNKDEAKATTPEAPKAVPELSKTVPELSACRLALTEEVALAPSIPPIHGPGACGGEDLVRLEAVVLPDKRRVSLTPAATMRCTMATAVVNWIRDDVAPLVNALGSEITTLDNFDSYQCRGRNGKSDGPLSEHAKANAIDVHGFKLADGRMIELTDRSQPRDFREAVLHSACARFPTVLGPDSDWYHEDHIHLDLIERRSNYRICQWDVLDPLPKVAPLMPESRPDDAPPRVVAEAEGDKAAAQGKQQAAGKTSDSKTSDKTSEPAGKGGTTKDTDAVSRKGTPNGTSQASAAPENLRKQTEPARIPEIKERDKATKSAQGAAATDERSDRTPDRPGGSKAAVGNVIGGKAENPPDQATVDGKSGPEKPERKSAMRKTAADKPAPRKRRRSPHFWSPFGALF